MRSRPLLAALLACLPLAASACSCMMPEPVDGTFPHQFVRRLPANAKGALFLAPPVGFTQIAEFDYGAVSIVKAPEFHLSPSDFEIKDGAGGKYRARVTPLELRGDDQIPVSTRYRYYAFISPKAEAEYVAARSKPALEQLLVRRQLKDISYSISDERRLFLVGPEGGFKPGLTYTITYRSHLRFRDRPAVVHEIAPEAVDTHGAYKLVLDGVPTRRMVTYAQGGTCSGDYLSLRQEFHFELPEPLKPYRDALTYLPEIERQDVPGLFQDTVIHESLCSAPEPELARNTGGRGAAVASCDTTRPLKLRGWVGFPEVDGKLQLVGPVPARFGSAKGHACTAVAMLNESLIAGDMDSAAYAACQVSNDDSARQMALDGKAPPRLPLLSAIARLMLTRPVPDACAADLMTAYARKKNEQVLQAVSMFAAIGGHELANPATRVQGMLDYGRMLDAVDGNSKATQLLQEQMEAKLPQITALLDSAKPEERMGDVLFIVSRMGERGRLAAPALKKYIRTGFFTSSAIQAMEKVAPGDPELPVLLQRLVQELPRDDSLLATYSRVANTRDSKVMLMKLVPHLASYENEVTVEVANYKLNLLLEAAPAVGPEKMKPVLEVLARKPLLPVKRKELKQLIVAMSASKPKEKELLDWLAAQP